MKAADFVLDLLFPVICLECGSEGAYLCTACQQKINEPEQRCFVCGKGSTFGKTHDACRSSGIALDGLIVAANYHRNSVKDMIWHLKYNSVSSISDVLAVLMADYFIKQDLTDYFSSCLVTSVPLHRKKLKSRGFNQAELISKKFASALGYECAPILVREKNSQSQTELKKEERQENVRNVFSAHPHPSTGERKIIIIDDVATTGATLNECAKVLRVQETGEIWGLVAARN